MDAQTWRGVWRWRSNTSPQSSILISVLVSLFGFYANRIFHVSPRIVILSIVTLSWSVLNSVSNSSWFRLTCSRKTLPVRPHARQARARRCYGNWIIGVEWDQFYLLRGWWQHCHATGWRILYTSFITNCTGHLTSYIYTTIQPYESSQGALFFLHDVSQWRPISQNLIVTRHVGRK